MKAISRFLLVLTVVLASACTQEGDEYSLLGTVFEVKGSFTAANNYSLGFNFPSSFEMVDGDVVMVYMLWETTQGGADVWRPLPQSRFLDQGVLQYEFDYTLDDVQIFIDGTANPASLTAGDLQNQTFRIAVIPADLAKNKSLNIYDFNAVMSTMKQNNGTIRTIRL